MRADLSRFRLARRRSGPQPSPPTLSLWARLGLVRRLRQSLTPFKLTGGDRSVLLTPLSALHSSSSTRPSSPIDAYTTGGRGGGGSVFALDVPDKGGGMVWAGVRRGECIGFDWRSARGGGGGEARTKEQVRSTVSSIRHGLLSRCTRLMLLCGVCCRADCAQDLVTCHARQGDPRPAGPAARRRNGRVRWIVTGFVSFTAALARLTMSPNAMPAFSPSMTSASSVHRP